eukprot:CAMPEP_0203773096 /NCGR_PEP_ID=MMETSP0099_2-20121227/4451_1 /ASSEMBLY_ACC=CAM_ASM_000209 /TAXON_ID=96639 /ORGANISM=" , Strain NY0313808BC1" /LENGTH=271 /DNA_ID=CAMNT_0050670855 /DNA_START=108 /DNA_END=924 /DNA_ORIENTATION=-
MPPTPRSRRGSSNTVLNDSVRALSDGMARQAIDGLFEKLAVGGQVNVKPELERVITKLRGRRCKDVEQVVLVSCPSDGERDKVDLEGFRKVLLAETEHKCDGLSKWRYRFMEDCNKLSNSLLLSAISTVDSVKGSMQPGKVFLGGACGPTTWRKDVAIPFLEASSISYFNPQVEEWSPDLVETEAIAKNNCELLFFVIGTETRSISSLVEASEYIASNRQVILVVKLFPDNSSQFSRDEIKDLNRGRTYLKDTASRHGALVFPEIEPALTL